MRGEIDRHDIEYDVQCFIGVQVKEADETDNLLPYRSRAPLYGFERL